MPNAGGWGTIRSTLVSYPACLAIRRALPPSSRSAAFTLPHSYVAGCFLCTSLSGCVRKTGRKPGLFVLRILPLDLLVLEPVFEGRPVGVVGALEGLTVEVHPFHRTTTEVNFSDDRM